MIHAFLVTIGILAAIYGFPYIVMALGLILVSPWFWMAVGGLLVLILCPAALPFLGLAYCMGSLVNWSNRRARNRAEV